MHIIVIGLLVLAFIIILLMVFRKTYSDECERLHHLLHNEVAEMEKLTFEDLEKLCCKEQKKEISYDDTKFTRIIMYDSYDDDKFLTLRVKVTIYGRMFKGLHESKEFVKERKIIPNKD